MLKKLSAKYPHISVDESGKLKDVQFSDARPTSWCPLEKASPHLLAAILLSEDPLFYKHNGLSLKDIWDVALHALIAGRLTRGASTITQQLVKNIYLSSARTLTRKLNEIILAIIVDAAISKKRILELYINIVDFGPHCFGISEGALRYFQKPQQDLSLKEAAFLASILPNPEIYGSCRKSSRLPLQLRKSIRLLLTRLRLHGYIKEDQYNHALDEKFEWQLNSNEAARIGYRAMLLAGSSQTNATASRSQAAINCLNHMFSLYAHLLGHDIIDLTDGETDLEFCSEEGHKSIVQSANERNLDLFIDFKLTDASIPSMQIHVASEMSEALARQITSKCSKAFHSEPKVSYKEEDYVLTYTLMPSLIVYLPLCTLVNSAGSSTGSSVPDAIVGSICRFAQ